MKFSKFVLPFLVGLFALGSLRAQSAQQVFDAAYWAHQNPAVAVPCQHGCSASVAMTLANQGLQVDVPIDVWNWDPYLVMTLRGSFGYTWVPAAGQAPVTVAPGLTGAGQAYDPSAPPTGSIMVSVNLADYPPFNPPTPVVAAAAQPLVGGLEFGCIYYAFDKSAVPNGATVAQNGQTFTKVVVTTPFGSNVYFTLNGCSE
jgi:hypothetical protein